MSDVYEPGILHQKAAYWAGSLGTDDYGQLIYAPVVEIKCRWEDTNEEILTPAGETVTSRSRVFVDRDLVIEGGILRLGTIASLTDPLKPFANSDAWRVQKFNKIPDEKAKKFVRIAYL